VREVAFQIGVGFKAGVKVGRDQKGVARDSYERIEYLCLGGSRSEECAFDIYIRRKNDVIMNG
jgi:hypothetical protein